MAGVFCWLYVTKPVVVTKTMIPEVESSPSLLVSQEAGATGDLVVKVENEDLVGETLNPELGFLPGEERSPEQAFANPLPGQGVEIIRVKRSERPLFEPLVKEDLPPVEHSENESSLEELASKVEIVEEAVSVQPADPEIEFLEEGSGLSGESLPADASSHWDGQYDEATRKVAISLMGEIVSDHELETKIIASSLDDLDLE